MAVETFNASTTWTCPAGVTSVQVECWGGGAKGFVATVRKWGGGGGAYSKANSISVTPGNNYTVTVGPGTSTSGNDTWFGSTGTCLAKGGSNGNGGASGSGVGDTKYSGGSGGSSALKGVAGGGGGSSAGTASNGAAGSASSGNTGGEGGTAPAGGGNGGNGGYYTTPDPVAGSAPGGGGGGPSAVVDGANGGAGRVVLTYTAEEPPTGQPAIKRFGGVPFTRQLGSHCIQVW